MSKPKRKLIDKYNIPINHIDFDYVKKCNNARELEKILQILYSGEEGYFIELIKCTEERLQLLAPNSKCFRRETEILKKDYVDKSEWEKDGEPVLEWSDEVKVKDNFLSVIANEKGPELCVPDIRGKNKRIPFTKEQNEKLKKKNTNDDNSDANKLKKDESKRIKSTDYKAWDKYDAETECLKMELDEERIKEENERNKLKKEKEQPKIEEITTAINLNKEIFNNLTNVEKESLSLKFKDRGNDYFRIKEYDSALMEYTKCIEIYPTSVVYNNRAITYMKLNLYNKAIEDLNKCLEIDPKNIKALLRKAQSLIGIDKRRDAYNVYTKIISIEPSNIAARNGLNDLNKQIPIPPPATATRISIKEDDEETDGESNPVKHNKTEKLLKSNSNDNNNQRNINSKDKELVELTEPNSDKNIKEKNIINNENNKEEVLSESNFDKNNSEENVINNESKKEKELSESSESNSDKNTKEKLIINNVNSEEKKLVESNESKSNENMKEKNLTNNTISVEDLKKQNSLKNIHDFISSLTNKTDEKTTTNKESKKIEEKIKNKENIQECIKQEINLLNQKSIIKNTESVSNIKKNQLEIKQFEKENQDIKSSKEDRISKSSKNFQQTLHKFEETNKQKDFQKTSKTSVTQITENKKQKKKTKIIDDEDYFQEDLAKLIIPKKIVRSKLAKTLDAIKNNKIPLPIPNMNDNQNKSENFKNTKSSINRIPQSPSSTSKTEIKLLPDKSKNEMFIKEIR